MYTVNELAKQGNAAAHSTLELRQTMPNSHSVCHLIESFEES